MVTSQCQLLPKRGCGRVSHASDSQDGVRRAGSAGHPRDPEPEPRTLILPRQDEPLPRSVSRRRKLAPLHRVSREAAASFTSEAGKNVQSHGVEGVSEVNHHPNPLRLRDPSCVQICGNCSSRPSSRRGHRHPRGSGSRSRRSWGLYSNGAPAVRQGSGRGRSAGYSGRQMTYQLPAQIRERSRATGTMSPSPSTSLRRRARQRLRATGTTIPKPICPAYTSNPQAIAGYWYFYPVRR